MTVRHTLLGMILLGALGMPAITRADPPVAGPTAATAAAATDDQSKRSGEKTAQQGKKNGQPDGKTGERTGTAEPHDDTAAAYDESGHAGTAAHSHDKTRGAFAATHSVRPRRSIDPRHRIAVAATGGGVRGLAVVGPPSGFGPKTQQPTTGLAVSGNAVARHSAVQPSLGNPITFDPKKHALVIIGGTAMARGRRS